MKYGRIGLSRKSALTEVTHPISVDFINRYFAADDAALRGLLVEYEKTVISKVERITALAYCTLHPDNSSAERAAWELCTWLKKSNSEIQGLRQRSRCHIRWLRACRRRCRNETIRELLTMAMFQLGDRKSIQKFQESIVGQQIQIAINRLKDDRIFVPYHRPSGGREMYRSLQGLFYLFSLRSRMGNHALHRIGSRTKQYWIKSNVGFMLAVNGCASGMSFLRQAKQDFSEADGPRKARGMGKFLVTFGLAWSGDDTAATDFERQVSLENDETSLISIYYLCQMYGSRSRSHRELFGDLQRQVERRIDPEKLNEIHVN